MSGRDGWPPRRPGAPAATLTIAGVPVRELGVDLLRVAGPGRSVLVGAGGEVEIVLDPAEAGDAAGDEEPDAVSACRECAEGEAQCQRVVEALRRILASPLPCGHRLADLIGGKGAITKCGACLAELRPGREGAR